MLIASAIFAICGEWLIAPRAWENLDYAWFYIQHEWRAGWPLIDVAKLLLLNILFNFLPMIILAALPFLCALFLERTTRRTR